MNDPLAPLLAGAFVIVCGLLVKRFPMLISGYNTLPKEKRKNVCLLYTSPSPRDCS